MQRDKKETSQEGRRFLFEVARRFFTNYRTLQQSSLFTNDE